jgi:hypothetical protein
MAPGAQDEISYEAKVVDAVRRFGCNLAIGAARVAREAQGERENPLHNQDFAGIWPLSLCRDKRNPWRVAVLFIGLNEAPPPASLGIVLLSCFFTILDAILKRCWQLGESATSFNQ